MDAIVPTTCAVESSNSVAELADLAQRINAEHALVAKSVSSGFEHARQAGRLLTEAKDKIGHGKWLPWLREHCQVSVRTAQAYMRVARGFAKLAGDEYATPVADLSFREALAQMTATVERAAEMGPRLGEAIAKADLREQPLRQAIPAVKREERQRREIARISPPSARTPEQQQMVQIGAGKITAEDYPEDVQRERWHQLTKLRQDFLSGKLLYGCHRLLRFVEEAERCRMYEAQGYGSLEDYVRHGLGLDPRLVRWAAEGYQLLITKELVEHDLLSDDKVLALARSLAPDALAAERQP